MNSSELIITVSGMRGIVGRSLTESVAADYSRAFATFLKNKFPDKDRLTVCIGRDSRGSGQQLASAATAALCASGINVIDLGVVTTPGAAIMTGYLGCAGGLIVTASHNPIEYNGIKLLLDNGMATSANVAEKIKCIYQQRQFSRPGSTGEVSSNHQTDTIHLDKVLGLVDKQLIAGKKFKAVLDSVNGAGGRVGRKLLTALGCEVIAINAEPTGFFAHPPEPLAENLTGLCEAVAAGAADVGFAQDPDADRLAVVDETGTYIGEEYSLALAAKYVFSERTSQAATNLSTSRMIDDIAAEAGCRVIRTPVGEANVAGAMIKNDCIIGGEGNGGVIDLRVAPVRDSLVGIAFVLQLMAQTGKSVSALAGEIAAYSMLKEKFPADDALGRKILDAARKTFAHAKLDTADGLRCDFDDAWIHLRASNTEPVMRIIIEAKHPRTAREYLEKVLDIRRKILG